MGKRGQVSIFLVIGLILMFSVIFYSIIYYSSSRTEIIFPKSMEALKSCTEEVIENVIGDVAFNGGYGTLPANVFSTVLGDVPVYSKTPSLEEVKIALETLASKQLLACEDKQTKIPVAITLSDTDVRATVTYLETKITVRIATQLVTLHSVAQKIFELVEKTPLIVPSSDLLDFEKENNVEIVAMLDENAVVYFIQSKQPIIIWSFATQT